jgi:uncharacterized DUF497 family protein
MFGKQIYEFSPEKNALLIEKRGMSFEEVISVLEAQGPLDVIRHPNQEKYPGQRMFIVEIDHYAYVVPFSKQDNRFFLKTIFPSRRATKKYLK